MCGIFGVIGRYSKDISSSLNCLSHRGPDDEDFYRDENIQLGFRRLSIIDLSSKGNQPMCNEDKSVWIVFNGEIYNFNVLKKVLSKNHSFKSKTDTEVLTHGYEEWGIDKLLKMISGMFAFCLYDKRKEVCYLVRDRVGKKPLYYYKAGDYFAFSSEFKAFTKLKGFSFGLNEEVFDLFMGFSYLPNNKNTLIRNVYKVSPGHYVKVDVNNLQSTQEKYWDFIGPIRPIDLTEVSQGLENLLIDSVKKRLAADVPVGILLSGGLDSSLITALAAKESNARVKTINISFENSDIDESEYAQIVSDYCKTDHLNLKIKVSNAYKEFKENIWLYDDLSTVDGGLFSTYLMAKEVRKLGVKVLLTGEGADEVFGGYSWFGFSKYPFRLLPDSLKSLGYYYAIMRVFDSKFFKYPRFLMSKLNEFEGSYFKKIQQYEIEYSLPNHYCMKLDKGSMGASVEARAPFLDYKVVEMALNLPEEYLLRGTLYRPSSANEKWILREIAKKYLPPKIYTRKKRGGMLPTYDILNEGLKKDRELILKNHYLNEFFGHKFLSRLIVSNPSNTLLKWQREWILWKCLVFSLWLLEGDTRFGSHPI